MKKFLARRKVQNVGAALKVINVLKGALRERLEKTTTTSEQRKVVCSVFLC